MGGVCGKDKTVYDVEIIKNQEPVENKKSSENPEPNSGPLKAPSDSEEISFLVGDVSSIQSDKFTEVKISEGKTVLVAKHGDNVFAIGDKCPHAGAPLIKGAVSNGKVRCPWHAACFDLKTGDLEDFPGFDCIPSYKVSIKEDKSVYVKLNPNRMVDRVSKPMKKATQQNQQVVIIGSGPSGYACAQTLREEGYPGKIVMVTQDAYLPYDRTKLTKKPGASFDEIKLRGPSFYSDNDIEVILNTTVENLNTEEKKLSLTGGTNPNDTLSYDSLYIAVGIRPRLYNPRLPGDDLKNIFYLHSLAQCLNIMEVAGVQGKELVLVGSSFISMELAEALSPTASKIHIVSRSRVPYGLAFGETIGEVLLKHFLSKLSNVVFHASAEVKEFIGDTGEVSEVITSNGEKLKCDLVVIAIGGTPNTQFLKDTGIQLHSTNNSILVNKHLEASVPNVYAGGDAVSFPFLLAPKERGSVAHWQVASAHGRLAALNILGRGNETTNMIPFFWTNVCGLQVRYKGYGEGYDETLQFGSVESLVFCVVYRRKERLTGVCCIGCDNLHSELALVFENNMEWIGEVPPAITQRFPQPPLKTQAQ